MDGGKKGGRVIKNQLNVWTATGRSGKKEERLAVRAFRVML